MTTAFQPYDTNNAMHQERLNIGCSPPLKKCDKSPQKVPMYADLLYREQPEEDENSGADFQFNLQSIAVSTASDGGATSVAAPGSVTAWKADFIGQINTFEQSFATRKADFLGKLDTNSINISDSFAQVLNPGNTQVTDGRSQNSMGQHKSIQR